MIRIQKNGIVLTILTLLFIALPFFVSGFWVRLVTGIFMFAILASALNIIAGFTGYAAFGNMIFFGVGAYTTAIFMNKLRFPFFTSLMLSGAIAVLLAIVLGLLLLRLKGHYFALATLGAAEGMHQLVNNLTDLTGGGQGMSLPQMKGSPFVLNLFFYFLMFFFLVIITFIVWQLSKNRLGYAFKAIRANEEAASVMGINTTYYKIYAWSLSGLFTGFTGGIYAYWFTYIDPPTVFDVMMVVKMFVIILIGGAGTVFGPIIGAFILESISELVWAKFINLHLGILGTIIMLVVIFMPNGIIDLVTNKRGFKGIIKYLKENKL